MSLDNGASVPGGVKKSSKVGKCDPKTIQSLIDRLKPFGQAFYIAGQDDNPDPERILHIANTSKLHNRYATFYP